MADFYTTAQRRLQEEFSTTALADRLAATIVLDELADPQVQFIESCRFFFLSTIDANGFPSTSHKGGARGFVRAPDRRSLVFPSYDGNGMFMSMGNIEDQGKVGLLFIDFEKPERLRVRGEARLLRDGPMLASYPGAQLVVMISIESIWQNCPRYVHKMRPLAESLDVPNVDGRARVALWKRIDGMQDVLNADDRAAAEAAGLIGIDEYAALLARGEDE